MVAPGQNFYHRLHDGEIFVYHGDERLCLACAQRRGFLSQQPRPLRESMVSIDLEGNVTHPSDYDLSTPDVPDHLG
jgi:hypothetical protein